MVWLLDTNDEGFTRCTEIKRMNSNKLYKPNEVDELDEIIALEIHRKIILKIIQNSF